MDIDESGIQRLMPHKIFDGQKVRPIFIEMGTKSMPEGMAGDPMLPSKGSFMDPHMAADIKGVDWAGRICLFREKPSGWTAVCKPVPGKDVHCLL